MKTKRKNKDKEQPRSGPKNPFICISFEISFWEDDIMEILFDATDTAYLIAEEVSRRLDNDAITNPFSELTIALAKKISSMTVKDLGINTIELSNALHDLGPGAFVIYSDGTADIRNEFFECEASSLRTIVLDLLTNAVNNLLESDADIRKIKDK